VLTKGANWITPILFGAIDDRSRLVCHLQWYTNSCCGHSYVLTGSEFRLSVKISHVEFAHNSVAYRDDRNSIRSG
jgi:hypothetical protein